ncbi:MAG: M23 family metallopeptidase [Dehalococcoidia bacterium]|nr:M23 family metallopeptidase [Dehalococcoidia bacterium]
MRTRAASARWGGTTRCRRPGRRGLVGLVGVGIADEAGAASMRIDVVGTDGSPYTFERAFTVLATDWLVEEIWFPTPTPGPTPTPDPDPPPPLPDDNEILPDVYAGMSARQWVSEWILPIDEPELASCESEASGDTACVSSYFGTRRSFNGGPVGRHHGGTDLAAWAGTPVRTTNGGTVVLAGEYRVRGNLVVVDHGGGVFSSYGHLSSIAVSEGEVVQQGDVVGEVGSTGLSTGPHLHWEMVVAGVLVDGLRWLDETQGF